MLKVGSRLPAAKLFELSILTVADPSGCTAGPKTIDVAQATANKKIAIFAVPGAFTPTCSTKHVPGYVEKADALKSAGMDEIWCVAVNDPYVMCSWGKDQKVGSAIRMMGDGSAEFTTGCGLLLDLVAKGFGMRSRRYSMIVDNGVVTALNVEEPGKFEVSDAASLLGQAQQRAANAISPEEQVRINAILDYWFGPDRAAPLTNFTLWYYGAKETDEYIIANFSQELQAAEAGKLNHWIHDKHAATALIIILDQFALNAYRDQPKGYNVSAMAVPFAHAAMKSNFHTILPQMYGHFITMPLMHSEKVEDQEICVEAAKVLGTELAFAVEHRDIVKKYGRFPGRNKVMGRASTAEEEEYLKNGGVF